jgi:hypothetical protein
LPQDHATNKTTNESDLTPLPPTPLGRYRHYKGGEYEIVGVARHSETNEPLVVYRPLYETQGQAEAKSKASGWWVRPHAMFFERVTIAGVEQPRFAFLTTAAAAPT